jgi:dienelactone hydrolase
MRPRKPSFACRWVGGLLLAAFALVANAEALSDKMQNHLTVNLPPNVENPPVVFFLQGSSGNNQMAHAWSRWFEQHGVASVMVDSAGARGVTRLFGVHYGGDLADALQGAKKIPNLSVTQYAVMGFSRGGTAALEAGSFLKNDVPKPDFVFALYPGDNSRCPNAHEAGTDVRVFYGELDDWGTFQGNRDACRKMAETKENASFHLMEQAHHGYDGSWQGTWNCCGGHSFTSAPNKMALEKTQQVILEAMQKKWKLKQ